MISVFIPCIPKHCWNLPNIVDAYLSGSVQPDEIVVGLSDCGEADVAPLRSLITEGVVKMVMKEEKLEAGPCRNLAYSHCKGDIVAYQDADDLPMRNRIEVVRKCFDENDIVALNHTYYFSNENRISMDVLPGCYIPSDIVYKKYFPNGVMEDAQKISLAYGHEFGDVHAGAVCVRREILKEVTWKSAKELRWAPEPRTKSEDWEFCFEVLLKYRKSAILLCPLYVYRSDYVP